MEHYSSAHILDNDRIPVMKEKALTIFIRETISLYDRIIFLMGLICIGLMIKLSGEPDKSIVYNLSSGYVISLIFYIIVVYLPSKKQTKVNKSCLKEQYIYFKQWSISTLILDNKLTYDDTMKMAKNRKEFRKFFDNSESSQRWISTQIDFSERKMVRYIEVIFTDLINYLIEVKSFLNNFDKSNKDAINYINMMIRNLRKLELIIKDDIYFNKIEKLTSNKSGIQVLTPQSSDIIFKFLWSLFSDDFNKYSEYGDFEGRLSEILK